VRRFQRLDAVAGARYAVADARAHFQRAMMMDVDQAAKAMRDEEMNAEIEDFIEGFKQPTYRGMRINGQRVATWSMRPWVQAAPALHTPKGPGRPRPAQSDAPISCVILVVNYKTWGMGLT
jgi:hypothetical protein